MRAGGLGRGSGISEYFVSNKEPQFQSYIVKLATGYVADRLMGILSGDIPESTSSKHLTPLVLLLVSVRHLGSC